MLQARALQGKFAKDGSVTSIRCVIWQVLLPKYSSLVGERDCFCILDFKCCCLQKVLLFLESGMNLETLLVALTVLAFLVVCVPMPFVSARLTDCLSHLVSPGLLA